MSRVGPRISLAQQTLASADLDLEAGVVLALVKYLAMQDVQLAEDAKTSFAESGVDVALMRSAFADGELYYAMCFDHLLDLQDIALLATRLELDAPEVLDTMDTGIHAGQGHGGLDDWRGRYGNLAHGQVERSKVAR